MFKTKYRIKKWIGMASGLERYCLQVKFWWLPFWFEPVGAGFFETVELADEFAIRHASKDVVKVFVFTRTLSAICAICTLLFSGCASQSPKSAQSPATPVKQPAAGFGTRFAASWNKYIAGATIGEFKFYFSPFSFQFNAITLTNRQQPASVSSK